MAWKSQHSFAAGEVVRAEWLKTMQNNLRELEHPQSGYSRRFDDALNPYNATTSSSFVDASGNYLQAKFTLTAVRSVFIVANIVAYTSAGDTEGELGISVDGIDQSGGHGIALVEWMDQPSIYPLSWLAEDLAVGEHQFKIRHRRTAGTGEMRTYVFSRHWFYAVEV